MMKPWVIFSIAGVTFLLVWSIVIFQFIQISKPALQVSNVNSIDRTDYTKLSEVAEVMDRESYEVHEDAESSEEHEYAMRDLRTIDFSDISTKDGIPVDAILNKLGLN